MTWIDMGEFSSSTSRSWMWSWSIRTDMRMGRILYWPLSFSGLTK